MSLTEELFEQFEGEGVLLLPDLFSEQEIKVFREAIQDVIARPGPNVMPEPRTDAVRMVHGAHDCWFHAGQDFTPLEPADEAVLTTAAAAG